MKDHNAKFKVGSTVYAKSDPNDPLIIRRYADSSYYCKLADNSDPTELVYFESEIMTLQEKREL